MDGISAVITLQILTVETGNVVFPHGTLQKYIWGKKSTMNQ